MRIANNVMAMNTHRAYTANNDKVQTSAEKLSSGYRINRAGDDAAGLAISEKMRSQIRGLNMSTKNSQDAVSLIQTAEGALQEVHSMLQRMNELAVQSATGTNETFDRTQIAKEFEQLKREINDISEQTTFNNMSILDGSLSAQGLQRTQYTSGVYTSFEKAEPTTSAGPLKKVELSPADNFQLGQKASFEISFADMKIQNAANKVTLKIESAGATAVEKQTTAAVASGATETTIRDAVWDELTAVDADTKKVTIKFSDTLSVDFNVTKNSDGKSLKFEAAKESDISKEMLDKIEFKITGETPANLKGNMTANKKVQETGTALAGQASTNATISKASFDFEYADAESGDSFTIGDQMYLFHNSTTDNDEMKAKLKAMTNAYEADTNNAAAGLKVQMVDLSSVNTASALAEEIYAKQGAKDTQSDATVDQTRKVGVNVSGKTITITYLGNAGKLADTNATPADDAKLSGYQAKVNGDIVYNKNGDTTKKSTNYGAGGDKYVAINSKPVDKSGEGTTTFELDLQKMKQGDEIRYQAPGSTQTRVYSYKEGDKMSDVFGALGIKNDANNKIEIDGNTWKVTSNADRSADIKFKAADDYKAGTYDAMKIQVGALEGEQLAIKISAMNTAGLGLDTTGIYDQATAGKAVTATRDAINKVSDQRALLGAMQNRMGHKIANLKVSVENLQASESRIRDIDIASEMTSFTKNNILAQAATAMLAQANSAPQNVLSLLR